MDTPSEIAAKQLGWYMETQTSVSLDVTTKLVPLGENLKRTSDFTSTYEKYIETTIGQRFSEFRGIKNKAVVVRSSHFSDRDKCADINYVANDTDVQTSVYFTNHFWMEDGSDRRQIPSPLLYFYVGRKPIYQALPKSEYLGTGQLLGRDCEIFLFRQVRWFVPQDQVFYLDKKSSVPLKVESFRDDAARAKHEPMAVWSANSLDDVQGHLFPLHSVMSTFGEGGKPNFHWESEVTSLKFNEEFPAATFQPVLQPGVRVLDSITNKAYQAPGGPTTPPVVPAANAAPKSGQVLQAIPPTNWSSYLATGGLLLGVAICLVGGFAWWRRR